MSFSQITADNSNPATNPADTPITIPSKIAGLLKDSPRNVSRPSHCGQAFITFQTTLGWLLLAEYYPYRLGSAELVEPSSLPKVIGRFSRPRQRGGDVLGRAVEREGPILNNQPDHETLNARVSRLRRVHECPFSFGIRYFAQMRSFNAQLVDAEVALGVFSFLPGYVIL